MSSIKLGGAWQAHHNQLLGLQMDAAALRGKLSASRKQIRISKQRQGNNHRTSKLSNDWNVFYDQTSHQSATTCV